mmetsp:Transcript_26716/g.62440  ORF Transcript_26716/g.62440 Transcript_26716/m.62440 type:complete len:238 (+) Transcript_26716:1295-2008(+)
MMLLLQLLLLLKQSLLLLEVPVLTPHLLVAILPVLVVSRVLVVRNTVRIGIGMNRVRLLRLLHWHRCDRNGVLPVCSRCRSRRSFRSLLHLLEASFAGLENGVLFPDHGNVDPVQGLHGGSQGGPIPNFGIALLFGGAQKMPDPQKDVLNIGAAAQDVVRNGLGGRLREIESFLDALHQQGVVGVIAFLIILVVVVVLLSVVVNVVVLVVTIHAIVIFAIFAVDVALIDRSIIFGIG